ncbi:hypothetical protein [Marinagarivorans algicola]|uniref:hypothetical protein n=1 Tax=Marinagarivorans algicola TaxID=1513270 RepID=UPI0006B9F0BA|nr:hypothetical protein [Marinagarivorans algicola]
MGFNRFYSIALKRVLNGVFLASCLLLSACGEDYIDNADAEVTVYLQPSVMPENNPSVFTLPSGTQVTIDKAYVALSALELMPCAANTVAQQWGKKVSAWLFTPVTAHSGTTPTRSGTPYWLDLTAEQSQFMAVLYPPIASYCDLELSFSRADDDTEFVLGSGTYSAEQAVITGQTFILEGQYTQAGSATTESLSIMSRKSLPVVNYSLAGMALAVNPVSSIDLKLDLYRWLGATEEQWAGGSAEEALITLGKYWH